MHLAEMFLGFCLPLLFGLAALGAGGVAYAATSRRWEFSGSHRYRDGATCAASLAAVVACVLLVVLGGTAHLGVWGIACAWLLASATVASLARYWMAGHARRLTGLARRTLVGSLARRSAPPPDWISERLPGLERDAFAARLAAAAALQSGQSTVALLGEVHALRRACRVAAQAGLDGSYLNAVRGELVAARAELWLTVARLASATRSDASIHTATDVSLELSWIAAARPAVRAAQSAVERLAGERATHGSRGWSAERLVALSAAVDEVLR
jgi:hypothetical protein